MMMRYKLNAALLALWREVIALTVGGAGALLLLGPGGAPVAAALALGVGATGAAALGLLTVRQGHLARALRWPRLCQALGLRPARLEQPRLAPIAGAAEEVLETIAGALPAVQSYLTPARRSTLELVERAVALAAAAGRHAHAARLLAQQAPDRALLEAAEQLEREEDPALRRQLDETLRSLRLQRAVRDDHRSALRRIEGELEAARQTLGAVDAQIEQADGALAAPEHDDRGALPQRRALQDQVSALAHAATEVKGGY